MPSIFGTDGVRGVANKELTPELVLKLGQAGGFFLAGEPVKGKRKKILVGRDTRLSGDMLEGALVAGLNSVGVDVDLLGVIPTPGVAYLARTGEYVGGVMISASHNPIGDNGIKFFNSEGFKLTDAEEEKVEDFLNNPDNLPRPRGRMVGRAFSRSVLLDKYLDFLVSTFKGDLKGYTVALDPACGAAWELAPLMWEKLGAQVVVINAEPDGNRINRNCGSTNPEELKKLIWETQANMGFAYDGDTDRVIALDEKGEILDGDCIMAICGHRLASKGQLKGDVVVATQYSNRGLEEALKKCNCSLRETKNGDRYVLEAMLKNNYSLGGEKSGHIIFLDYNTTGDGLLTSLHLAQCVRDEGRPLSELSGIIKMWPQLLENVRVESKKWQGNDRIKEGIKKAEKEVGEGGRIFVRASGTEPVIRVMMEGKQKEKLQKAMDYLTEIIKEELN